MNYGKQVVLENVTFRARPGEITGLLGKNGAGKTTALRILTGLSHQKSGVALINGQEFGVFKPGTIGVALSTDFPPSRKVVDQLKITGWAYGVKTSRISQVIEELDMLSYLNVRTKKLSMGMKQRLNVACAILSDPQTLIFDEPVNGLDPEGIQWIHTFMQSEASRGKTVLVSSHFLHDMDKYVDHVVILQKKVLLDRTWSSNELDSLQSIYEKSMRNE